LQATPQNLDGHTTLGEEIVNGLIYLKDTLFKAMHQIK